MLYYRCRFFKKPTPCKTELSRTGEPCPFLSIHPRAHYLSPSLSLLITFFLLSFFSSSPPLGSLAPSPSGRGPAVEVAAWREVPRRSPSPDPLLSSGPVGGEAGAAVAGGKVVAASPLHQIWPTAQQEGRGGGGGGRDGGSLTAETAATPPHRHIWLLAAAQQWRGGGRRRPDNGGSGDASPPPELAKRGLGDCPAATDGSGSDNIGPVAASCVHVCSCVLVFILCS